MLVVMPALWVLLLEVIEAVVGVAVSGELLLQAYA